MRKTIEEIEDIKTLECGFFSAGFFEKTGSSRLPRTTSFFLTIKVFSVVKINRLCHEK